MHHFYISQEISGDTVEIAEAELLHHVRDVLRLKPGDEVSLFDNKGNEYISRLAVLGKTLAAFNIINVKPARPRNHMLTFACALPKKSLIDDIIDQLTQLDVDVIIPMMTERVVVKLDEDRQSRLERWRKIARSAAEQSRRNTIPSIPGIMSLPEVLDSAKNSDVKLIPTLEGERQTLKEALSGSPVRDIFVLIGPEGDFSLHEIEMAVNTGFIPVSLGESVLRAETAAIAVAGYLRFYLNEQ